MDNGNTIASFYESRLSTKRKSPKINTCTRLIEAYFTPLYEFKKQET